MTEPVTHATRAGKVDLGSGKAQHVDLFRKLGLRRELLAQAGPGVVYAPFLGEADIAAELYADRSITGVELDPAVADRARARLVGQVYAHVITGDAEVWHDEADAVGPYAIADVDAFSNPYVALEAFWRHARLADRVVVFGTDGMRLAIRRSKSRMINDLPSGLPLKTVPINERRRQWNAWWTETVEPYLAALVAPGRIVASSKYLRDHMLYWGIVVDRAVAAGVAVGAPDAPGPTDVSSVEAALLEAAKSGNVTAAIFWLEHNGGPKYDALAAAEEARAKRRADRA